MKKCILLLFAFCLFTSHLVHSQWYQQTVPVTNSITGIEFIDSLRGWACTDWNVGSTSYIISTTDGGLNWVTQFSLTGNKFTTLDIVNANTGYVAGWNLTPGDAFVYKTTNGGLNWYNLNAAIGVDADDIFFINPDSGYLCADFSVNVYATTNGGLNWILRNSGITQHPSRLYFLNYSTGFCGADGYLYKTTNAGQSWFAVGNFTEGVRSVFFLNENTGWLGMTPSGSSAKVKFTTNGGVNWITQELNPYNLTITDLYFVTADLGWAGIDFPLIYKTINAGTLWGYQRDSSGSYRMSFVDSLRGWTGDTPGKNIISHTTNGGGPITYVGVINTNNHTPATYSLLQNYPNPFNSRTQIRFSLTKPSYVKLKIYDVLGREKTIWESTGLLSIGTHKLEFNAQNYSSGVYFYQITVLNEQSSVVYRETRKMILVK